MKETTMTVQIELTKILKNEPITLSERELESFYRQMVQAHTCDDAHVKVKFFEHEEKKISTEDLIKAFRYCYTPPARCTRCVLHGRCGSRGSTRRLVADRLEELHNERTKK